MKASRLLSYRVPCEAPSKWTVELQRDGEFIRIGLIWGNNDGPNQGVDIPLEFFREICKELCAP